MSTGQVGSGQVGTATLERPAEKRPKDGGVPARRAVIRWAVRLLRREWRQQLLIFALITVAVAATFIASAVATTTPASPAGTLGTAQDAATFSGTNAQVASDISAVKKDFGQADVIEDQQVSVPGSVQTFDLRAQDPHGPFGQPLLSLVSGSYPTTASQVAVTSEVAADFSLHAGSTWTVNGVRRTVTGIAANPQNLLDEFALVIPGEVTSPDTVTVLFNAPGMSADHVSGLLFNASSVSDAQSLSNQNAINPETISLAAAILGMLLIALVSVGGFTVLAQRRLRSIGMLAAQGATEGHIRLVVRANGVATGVTGAAAGFMIGLVAWLLYRPTAESSAHHEIGTFQLPWTVIIVSMVLALVATYFAASRPARQISRVPVVAALSGRPPAPRKAGRLAPPAGIVLLVISFLLLGAAGATPAGGQTGGGQGNQLLELAVGLIALCVAIVLLASTLLGVVAWLGRRSPISVRLALRDLSRYRSRSGPALAAIAIATLIAVIVCVETAGRFANVLDYAGPNLTSNQLVVYTAPPAGSILHGPNGPQVQGPTLSVAAQAKIAQNIARSLGTTEMAALYSTSAGLTHAASGRSW
ncbi:MAG TPA: FtsX-like permease family protein, partial [Trebonia sp.]